MPEERGDGPPVSRRQLGTGQRLPKRFYEHAAVETRDDGHRVLLDGRSILTPGKTELALGTARLARAVAAEWAEQGPSIDPDTMPLTRLANTALDRVRGREAAVMEDIVGYAGSDLLCYRADRPRELVARQNDQWDPVLDWMAERHGAVFECALGIMHVNQPAESLQRVRDAVSRFDAFGLTALHTMTTLTGSALLALACAHGRLSCDQAWVAAHVDEDWQISQWGEDEEATQRRRRRQADMIAAGTFMTLSET